MKNFIIFILDKSNYIGKLIDNNLPKEPENEIITFNDKDNLIDNLYKKPDVIIFNSIKYNDYIDLINICNKKQINTEIIIISNQSTIEIEDVANFLKNGAYDFIIKNDRLEIRLLNDIKDIKKNKFIPERFINNFNSLHLIGESKKC